MESEEGSDQDLKVGKLLLGQKVRWGGTKCHAHLLTTLMLRWTLVLVDRGVNEPEERKISTSTLVRFERDSR